MTGREMQICRGNSGKRREGRNVEEEGYGTDGTSYCSSFARQTHTVAVALKSEVQSSKLLKGV